MKQLGIPMDIGKIPKLPRNLALASLTTIIYFIMAMSINLLIFRLGFLRGRNTFYYIAWADRDTFSTLDTFLIVDYRQILFYPDRIDRTFLDALTAGDTAYRTNFDYYLSLRVRGTSNIHFSRLGNHPDNLPGTFLNTKLTGPTLFGNYHGVAARIYYNRVKRADIPTGIIP